MTHFDLVTKWTLTNNVMAPDYTNEPAPPVGFVDGSKTYYTPTNPGPKDGDPVVVRIEYQAAPPPPPEIPAPTQAQPSTVTVQQPAS